MRHSISLRVYETNFLAVADFCLTFDVQPDWIISAVGFGFSSSREKQLQREVCHSLLSSV
jgi:hypothetical protein